MAPRNININALELQAWFLGTTSLRLNVVPGTLVSSAIRVKNLDP